MLSKRIIPCLDIKDGETVKGVNFVNLRSAGDPIELAKRYVEERADELVFLDITATVEGRKTFAKLVHNIAREINIPFTVGGGISSVEDVRILLEAGADKVSVNSAAVKRPELINELSKEFGSQCIVCAIDTNCVDDTWYVYVNGGRVSTEIETISWAKEVVSRGAGEILLTSMASDGTKAGFSLEITQRVRDSVEVPVIASGGAGNVAHFSEVFSSGAADAALAASVFHFGEISIPALKVELEAEGIEVRK